MVLTSLRKLEFGPFVHTPFSLFPWLSSNESKYFHYCSLKCWILILSLGFCPVGDGSRCTLWS